MKVHFIDVREGDAILVQYEGENYLIDSGRNLSSNQLITYVDSVGLLLTGESETENNQYLLDEYDLDVEVLKVSHHGAFYSFLSVS